MVDNIYVNLCSITTKWVRNIIGFIMFDIVGIL